MSIDIAELGSGDDVRRDGWGRYLIVPPERVSGPVGYTRATTVAGTLDSGGGLAPWKATMAIVGTVRRRGLRAQWEALVAEYDGDPWYGSLEGKKECKKLVEESAKAGGARDRAEMGTSLHALTALIDVGRPPQHVDESTERDLAAYTVGLHEAGVVVVEGMVERIVVLDGHRVAGTFDRLVTVPGFPLPLVADLKTGADLSYSWQSICVQEAIYSRGQAIYNQGAMVDGSQDTREPMPAVDQSHGLVMWLNAGTGMLELWIVDLEAGWEGFKRSMWVRDWRARDDLAKPLSAFVSTVRDPIWHNREQVRKYLTARIQTIGAHPQARQMLVDIWPEGMAPLSRSTEHSVADLEWIGSVLDQVEREYSLPFGTGAEHLVAVPSPTTSGDTDV